MELPLDSEDAKKVLDHYCISLISPKKYLEMLEAQLKVVENLLDKSLVLDANLKQAELNLQGLYDRHDSFQTQMLSAIQSGGPVDVRRLEQQMSVLMFPLAELEETVDTLTSETKAHQSELLKEEEKCFGIAKSIHSLRPKFDLEVFKVTDGSYNVSRCKDECLKLATPRTLERAV